VKPTKVEENSQILAYVVTNDTVNNHLSPQALILELLCCLLVHSRSLFFFPFFLQGICEAPRMGGEGFCNFHACSIT